jgi:hypothetical protein
VILWIFEVGFSLSRRQCLVTTLITYRERAPSLQLKLLVKLNLLLTSTQSVYWPNVRDHVSSFLVPEMDDTAGSRFEPSEGIPTTQ